MTTFLQWLFYTPLGAFWLGIFGGGLCGYSVGVSIGQDRGWKRGRDDMLKELENPDSLRAAIRDYSLRQGKPK